MNLQHVLSVTTAGSGYTAACTMAYWCIL